MTLTDAEGTKQYHVRVNGSLLTLDERTAAVFLRRMP